MNKVDLVSDIIAILLRIVCSVVLFFLSTHADNLFLTVWGFMMFCWYGGNTLLHIVDFSWRKT